MLPKAIRNRLSKANSRKDNSQHDTTDIGTSMSSLVTNNILNVQHGDGLLDKKERSECVSQILGITVPTVLSFDDLIKTRAIQSKLI